MSLEYSVIESKNFNESKFIHDLKPYLPTQTPLKDFINHNTFHAFQGEGFCNVIFKNSKSEKNNAKNNSIIHVFRKNKF